MSALAGLRHRLRRLFDARRLRRELEEEMRIHIALDAEDRLRRGVDPAGAARDFGDVRAWAARVDGRSVFEPRLRRRGMLLGSTAAMMLGGTCLATVAALSWQIRDAGAGDPRFTFVLALLIGVAALLALVGAIGSAQLSLSASLLEAAPARAGCRAAGAVAATVPVSIAVAGAVVLARALASALAAAVPAEALAYAPSFGQANVPIATVIGVTLIVALPTACVSDLRSTAGYGARAAAWWQSGAAAWLVRGTRQTQAGFTLLIVAVATVMVLSVQKLERADIGVRAAGLWTARVTPPAALDASGRAALYESVQQAVMHTRDVSDAGAITHLPLTRASLEATAVTTDGSHAGRRVPARVQHASAGYFTTAGIAVVAGRTMSDSDVGGATPVIVVNENFAIRSWGAVAASLGRTVDALGESRVVIGVTGNVMHHGANAHAGAELYLPLAHAAPAAVDLVFAATSAAAAELAVARASAAAGPAAHVSSLSSMREVQRRFYAPTRLVAVMLATMAALSLMLTTIMRHATRRDEYRAAAAWGSASRPWIRTACIASAGALSAAVIALALRPVAFGMGLPDVLLLIAVSAVIAFVLFDGRPSRLHPGS